MPLLHAVEGPLKGHAFRIPEKTRVIVGRYEVYDLVVPDPSISRKHFALETRDDGFYLIDLGSLNGTQLNGHRVSTAKLEQGDRISAGESVLAYDETDSATAPAAAPAAAAPAAAAPADGQAAPPRGGATPRGGGTGRVVVAQPTVAVTKAPAQEADDEIVPLSDADIIDGPPGPGPDGVEPVDVEPLDVEIVDVEPLDMDGVEPLDVEIVSLPPEDSAGDASPATVPMPVTKPPAAAPGADAKAKGASAKRKAARESAKAAAKASGKASAKEKRTSGSLGRCAACGKKVIQEKVDAGEGAKTRLGYVCGRCIEKRQKSGGKGSLEKFIMDRQRRRR